MLLNFSLANHGSIRDEHDLTLIPVYDKDRPAVPVAAVYGANGSGKSTLISAFAFMRDAVRSSFSAWEPLEAVPRTPFKLDAQTDERPSSFSVEVQLEDVRFIYGFVIDGRRVLEEWLHVYPHRRKRVVFSRVGDEWTFGTDTARLVQPLQHLTANNVLFLSVAARAQWQPVMPLYRWFASGLTVLSDAAAVTAAGLERPGRRSRQSVQHWDHLVGLTKLADVGIRTIKLRKEQGRTDVVFVHEPHGTELTLQEQSAGTRAWLAVVAAVLTALADGTVLVVDELDASLHPRLVARLIDLFRDERVNAASAQLVFTTHDATLLGTSLGGETLRRDEVWFFEKGGDGASRLFPLSDFHPRAEENTERRYLGGSYGAVPAAFSDSIRDIFPERFADEGTGRGQE